MTFPINIAAFTSSGELHTYRILNKNFLLPFIDHWVEDSELTREEFDKLNPQEVYDLVVDELIPYMEDTYTMGVYWAVDTRK